MKTEVPFGAFFFYNKMALPDLLNQVYDSFATNMRQGPLSSVQNANAGINTIADQQAGQNVAHNNQLNQGVLQSMAGARNKANSRSVDSIKQIQQSIQNAFGAFGRTPQTIGNPPTDYSELQPALTHYADQTNSQFQNQAQGINRTIGMQEANQQLTNADYLAAIANWQNLLKLRENNQAQQQRDALDREIMGANLERSRTLANIKAAGG